jgi:NAD(P)-dependent dehydrogenase (short-subunit alcohol dehydrogenase family)
VARRFREWRSRVALLDIDEDGRERAMAGLVDSAKSALPLCCDVADEPEVKRAVASASESCHGLVTFVTNAAIEHPGDSRVRRESSAFSAHPQQPVQRDDNAEIGT